jgi:signal transduction histidine kinase
MVAAAPAHTQVVAIVPKAAPGWLRNLTEHCGFMAAPSVRSILRRASRDEMPACIVGAPTMRVLGMFQSLRAASELPHRPLLVLLSHFPAPVSVADFVWTPEPSTLLHNLDMALTMREHWRTLVAQQAHPDASDIERLMREQATATEQLHLLKATIVQTAAHELRTPMMQVKSAVQLLHEADTAQDGDHIRELLEYATASTARLEGVISNLILLSEAFSTFEYDEVLLTDALELALRNLRRIWAHREHIARVRAVYPPQLPLVHADRKAISIVLQLLLDNALKFSAEEVEVEFTPTPTHVQVCVRDRGIGIEPERQASIFDSFIQADGSSTRKFGGMGVGLAIARQIVEAHGGRIVVNSVPREGSEFFFGLPFERA